MIRDIRSGKLGITGLMGIFAALAVVLLVLLAFAPKRSTFTEWRAAQDRYNALAKAAGKGALEPALRQIWKPELAAADRCGSCHLAAAGEAQPLAGDPLFAAHPRIPHKTRELGCTICHGGDGRATSSRPAHGEEAHWHEPLLSKATMEAGCGTCHTHLRVPNVALAERGASLFAACQECHKGERDLAFVGLTGFRADWQAWHLQQVANLAASGGVWAAGFAPLADDEVLAVEEFLRTRVGAPKLLAAKTIFHQWGCRGCHRIDGVGGEDGPDLTDEGQRRPEDLSFTHVDGPRTLAAWLAAHTLDPAKASPGSRMPKLGLSPAEADQVTLYLLSLKKRTIPLSLAPPDRLRGRAIGDRDFPTDGASLFGTFCAGCHGKAGVGRSLGEQNGPQLANAESLAVLDDATLRRMISEGRPERRMPAWVAGGLHADEIDALVTYLRSREAAPPALAAVQPAPVDHEVGSRLFATRCAPCHGDSGQGSAIAPPLAAQDNTVTQADERIYGTLTAGVQGTAMGSFKMLSASELHSVIAFVRELPRLTTSRMTWVAKAGDAKHGGDLYFDHCAYCHGPHGEGGDGPALANAHFQAAVSDGQLAATIIRGRPGTTMPTFGTATKDHPKLLPPEVADLVAFLRTLPKG